MLALLGEGPGIEPPQPYDWKDLKIGMRIPVASLEILLIDADEFTVISILSLYELYFLQVY